MKYQKKQTAVDQKNGIVRVVGIMFEENASDDFIDEVIDEVFSMDTIAPGLATAKALWLSMGAYDEYVFVRMEIMPIGTSFNYMGNKITRWSKHTYNAKSISSN